MKKILSMIMVASISLFLLGCNTTRGIGQDIEQTGENIKDTADDI
ncbi:MAG: entericidin A/B family lipoprotein [Candidatus Omnitrophica bacterium]|nr:entericidin A/B family lipoprotein [Candidatus Omnitrophota bacterium]